MSLALTERLPFTSPARKPSEAANGVTMPLTLASVTVTRLLSAMPVRVTITSLPELVDVAAPTVALAESITATPPAAVTGLLNRNTSVCPLPITRDSVVTAPPMAIDASTVMSNGPARPCVLRDATLTRAKGGSAEGVTFTVAESAPLPALLVANTLHA